MKTKTPYTEPESELIFAVGDAFICTSIDDGSLEGTGEDDWTF